MKYTADEVKKIIDLHKTGKNTVDIAIITKKSQSGIERLLRSAGVYNKANRLKIQNVEDINAIINLYINDRLSTEKIALMYNVSDNTISSLLRRSGVTVTRKRSRTAINSSYFESIDSEYKAYFLGFIIADGSVVLDKDNGKKYFSFGIVEKDNYILMAFSREVSNSKLPIYICEFNYRQNMAYIKFGDEEFISCLEKYGVIPNKTLFTFMPDIPDEYIRHFIRGYFDGDGCICFTNNKLVASFTGSKILIPEVLNKLYMDKVIETIPAITDRGNFCSTSFAKKQSIINFYHYLYDDSNIYLTRKRDKFTGVLGSNI